MLTERELGQLQQDLLDLIEERAYQLLGDQPGRAWREDEVLEAAIQVDAGLRRISDRVSLALDRRAYAAGLTYGEIGDLRGMTKQGAHRRVNAR